MVEGAKRCGATIVQQNFHMFNPYGVSGVVILAESHFAIHTWPEYGYAAVDLFTCGGNCKPEVAYEFVKDALGAGASFYSELNRGLMNRDTDEMIKAPFSVQHEVADTPEASDAKELVSQVAGQPLNQASQQPHQHKEGPAS